VGARAADKTLAAVDRADRTAAQETVVAVVDKAVLKRKVAALVDKVVPPDKMVVLEDTSA
jgi:hypothetical protein